MTKICGLASDQPNFEVERPLKAAFEASWQPTYERQEMWHRDHVGLGHMSVGAVNVDPQPIIREAGNEAIVYCGKIFGYDALKADLERQGTNFELTDNDAEFLAALLRNSEPNQLADINGIFSLAVWNQRQKSLTLVSDRYGLRSLYYYHDVKRGIFVFSSDLRGIVVSGLYQREINWPACSNFLYFGHHLGNDTWFRDVHLIPPASLLIFQHNNVRIEPYWDINSISIDDRIDYPTAVEECGRLFAQAIRRQNVPVHGQKTAFLSGGLDSRRIAAELNRQGADFDTYTTGPDESSPDPFVARQVADALGVKNTLICLPRKNLMTTYWPRCNRLVDYETKLHQGIMPLVEQLPNNIKVNYDGLAGDIPFNGIRRDSEFVDQNRFQQALSADSQELAKTVTGPELGLSIFSGQLRDHLSRNHALEAARAELDKYGSTHNQLQLFYLMNRTRRATALCALKLLTLKVESFFPYLDNDLFDFVMSVPPLTKITNHLREDMCKAYPQVDGIPLAVHVDSQGRNAGWQQHPDYKRQRRQYFLWLIRHRYFGTNWAFNNSQAGPKLLKDLILYYTRKRHISYTFNESFSTFYNWLAMYYPNGIK